MSSDPTAVNLQPATPAKASRPIRVWPAVLLVVLFWAVYVSISRAALPISTTFLSQAAATLALLLAYPIWWLTNRTVPGLQRLKEMGLVAASVVAGVLLTLNTLEPVGALLLGIPVVFTAWTVWLLITRKFSPHARLIGLCGVLALAWLPMLLVRMDGLSGDLQADLSWRWSQTAEERFLEWRAREGKAAPSDSTAAEPLRVQPGDWPGLRGPNRDGEVRGQRIATDWQANPPKLVWRREVGPAWSSMSIVGNRLFTQEQRGPQEATLAVDAETGQEIWSHENTTRFWDSQSGAGPRGTPTFDDGRLYVMGGTGILDCLDAASGKLIWSRDMKIDAKAPTPMWGFSSSPLVVDGVVIVYAGGPDPQGVVAYRASDGEPAWSAPAGPISYGSAQLVEIDGQKQILFLADDGLVAVRPSNGEVLWRHEASASGMWRAVQPRLVGAADVLIGSEDMGLVRLGVARQDEHWKIEKRYASNGFKPAYNDFAIHDGFAYGFDGNIFCAVDLANGKRIWKAGRYGHGQAVLLVDQQVLLVTSEQGEVVLLAANPKQHEELARFQAIEGKTWNHPAIAHGKLYVRNGEEMACFELKQAEQ